MSRPARTEDRRAEVRKRPGQYVRRFTGSQHGEERLLGTLAATALARGTIEVVGEAATHEGAVALVSQLKPDVVLLALEMLGGAMGGSSQYSQGFHGSFRGYKRCTDRLLSEGVRMSDEQQRHPKVPAEGSEQDVGAPGADRAGNDTGTIETAGDEAEAPKHPNEPAEGGEEDVQAPGAERAGEGS